MPRWAVSESSIAGRLYAPSKNDKNKLSLWSNRSGLGTFFGSPSESREYSAEERRKVLGTESGEKRVLGVGLPYSLHTRVVSVLSGEWVDECDALTLPSLRWSQDLLSFMLEHPDTVKRVLTPSLFITVAKHVQSRTAPMPLSSLPVIMRMIRQAQIHDIELPVEAVEGLCRAVLQKAVNMNSNGNGLPQSMTSVIDLVVAVQAAQVARNARKT